MPVLSVGDFAAGQDNGIPKHFKVLRLQYKGDYRFGFPLHEYINQGCKYITRATNKSAVTLCTVHTTCYCIQVIYTRVNKVATRQILFVSAIHVPWLSASFPCVPMCAPVQLIGTCNTTKVQRIYLGRAVMYHEFQDITWREKQCSTSSKTDSSLLPHLRGGIICSSLPRPTTRNLGPAYDGQSGYECSTPQQHLLRDR